MRFDLVDLQLFLHVAEAANITQGAAMSNIALASASERVRKMEELAGVALLERGRRGVILTPAGRAFAHHARLALQHIESMKGELSEYAGGLKGYVRMQANASALSEFLPAALKEFLAAHPGIDVDLEERPSYEIIRSVAQGFADIGIVADIVDFGGLEVYPFATDRLVAVTPRGHPFARERRLAFRALLDQEFVGMAATNALQQHLGQHAMPYGWQRNWRSHHPGNRRAEMREERGNPHVPAGGCVGDAPAACLRSGLGRVGGAGAAFVGTSQAAWSGKLSSRARAERLEGGVQRLGASPPHPGPLRPHGAEREKCGA